MITNIRLKADIATKIQRIRATGKEVYVNWIGGQREVITSNVIDGIIIQAGSVRINVDAKFINEELGPNATMDMVERCFYVRTQPQTIADYE